MIGFELEGSNDEDERAVERRPSDADKVSETDAKPAAHSSVGTGVSEAPRAARGPRDVTEWVLP